MLLNFSQGSQVAATLINDYLKGILFNCFNMFYCPKIITYKAIMKQQKLSKRVRLLFN